MSKPTYPWLNYGQLVRTTEHHRRLPAGSIGIVVGVNSFFATIQAGAKRVQVPRDHLACDTPKDGQELRDTLVGLNAIIEKKNQKRASLSRKEDAEAGRE